MSDNVTISVIMPVYNAEKHLKKSVDSVINQTYKNFELIVIDDGSTDLSGKICDEYAATDKRIKVIHQKNSGVSKARNSGIEASKGKYIVFLDSDDEMDSNLLEDNLKIADKLKPDVLIFNFRYRHSDQSVNNEFKQDELFFGDNERFFNEKLETVVEKELMNAPWNKIIRSELIKSNKLCFDERYSILEDAMFSLSVCANAKTICVNSEIYHSYYIWETGSLRTKWSENRFLAIKELYKLEKKYCSKYSNNKHQLHFFGKIFCNSIFAFMQLVSVNTELSFKKRREVIKDVCNDNKVRQVFLSKQFKQNIGINKKIIRLFVKLKMITMIILMYKAKHRTKRQ